MRTKPRLTINLHYAHSITMDNGVEYIHQTCDGCGVDAFTRRLRLDLAQNNGGGAGTFLCLNCWTDQMISRSKTNQDGVAYPWKIFDFDEVEPLEAKRIPDNTAKVMLRAFSQYKNPTDWSDVVSNVWETYGKDDGINKMQVMFLWMDWFDYTHKAVEHD
jgi:hypothetical protein